MYKYPEIVTFRNCICILRHCGNGMYIHHSGKWSINTKIVENKLLTDSVFNHSNNCHLIQINEKKIARLNAELTRDFMNCIANKFS